MFPHIRDEKIKQMITFPFISILSLVVRSRDNEINAWMTITEEENRSERWNVLILYITFNTSLFKLTLGMVYVHEQIDINILCWSFSVYICFGIVGNNNVMPFRC